MIISVPFVAVYSNDQVLRADCAYDTSTGVVSRIRCQRAIPRGAAEYHYVVLPGGLFFVNPMDNQSFVVGDVMPYEYMR